MALLTDGNVTSIEELSHHETQILSLASTEGIDLMTKLGLAQEEIGLELTRKLQGFGRQGAERAADRPLRGVVVTPALRLWHVFHTLSLVYRDAYFNQLNDRYLGKWKEYRALAQSAAELLFQIGAGMVARPLDKPAAPKLESALGGGAAETYFVQTSWTGSSEVEGVPSEVTCLSTPPGGALRVTPTSPPAPATGWNVYVGLTAEGPTRQNTAPLALDASWTIPLTGLVAGPKPGKGQEPETLRTLPRVQQIG